MSYRCTSSRCTIASSGLLTIPGAQLWQKERTGYQTLLSKRAMILIPGATRPRLIRAACSVEPMSEVNPNSGSVFSSSIAGVRQVAAKPAQCARILTCMLAVFSSAALVSACAAQPRSATGDVPDDPPGAPTEAVSRYRPAPSGAAASPPPATVAEMRARAAGAGNGTFQVTLTWENRNDLDLHLLTPCGDEVYFGAQTGCGIINLDVDMNVAPTSDTPVEHMNAELARMPHGKYEVHVVRFRNHIGADADNYVVELRLGDEVKRVPGRISGRGGLLSMLTQRLPEVTVTTFTIP